MIDEIVLVVAPEEVERARRELLRPNGRKSERVVAGGEERQESVASALQEISADAELVVIHDGARPLVKEWLIERCIEAATARGAAIAAVQCTDTVKEEGGREGEVGRTLERGRLWLVQTPQAFRREVILRAHQQARKEGAIGTDDALLVERMGHPVALVEGDRGNIKVTWPEDVRRIEQIMEWEGARLSGQNVVRVGIGYDAHRFVKDRPLVLGGVMFAEKGGLLGHSDADVVCHAICDALLGAIGAGDIGGHFPDSDPQYAGISSLSLLTRVMEIIRAWGGELDNVDVVVVTERPKIAARVTEMKRALAEAMGVECSQVNVKGKTSEGMGFTGRGEGIASHAVATLRVEGNMRAGADSKE